MKSSAPAGGSEDLDSRLIQLNAELRRERDRLAADLEGMGVQNVELAFQVGELEEQLAQLRSERDQALSSTAQLQTLEAALADLRSEVAVLRSRATQQDAGLAAAERLEQEARGELAEARQALDEALLQGTRLQEELQALHQETQEALRERDRLRQELSSEREVLQQVRASLAEALQSESQRRADLEGIQGQLAEHEVLRRELQESRLQTLRLEEKVSELKRQVLDRSSPTAGQAAATAPQGQLAVLLEENLGATGRVLLDKARDRCDVAATSAEAADLEALVLALKEPALRLCRTPQQRGRLETGLADLLGTCSVRIKAPPVPSAPSDAEPTLADLLEAGPEGRSETRLRGLVQNPESCQARDRVVVSLLLKGLDPARQAEAEASVPTPPWTRQLLDQATDPELGNALDYILEEAVPRSGLAAGLPSADFAAWDTQAQEAPPDWFPAELARRLADGVFGFSDLRIRQGRGPDLVAASRAPEPVLILNPDLERLSGEEVAFLVGHELLGLFRRHVHLVTACRAMDGRARARLIRRLAAFMLERGTDLPPALLGDTSALWGTEPPERIRALLDDLYRLSPLAEIHYLKEFLLAERPFQALMDREADRFAGRLSGLSAASAALVLKEAGMAVRQGCEREGFQFLYRPPVPEHQDLRRRLQGLWEDYLD